MPPRWHKSGRPKSGGPVPTYEPATDGCAQSAGAVPPALYRRHTPKPPNPFARPSHFHGQPAGAGGSANQCPAVDQHGLSLVSDAPKALQYMPFLIGVFQTPAPEILAPACCGQRSSRPMCHNPAYAPTASPGAQHATAAPHNRAVPPSYLARKAALTACRPR